MPTDGGFLPPAFVPQGQQGGYGGGYQLQQGYGAGGGYQLQQGYGGGQGGARREGDWDCGACAAHNFASRGQCFKCHVAKDEGAMGGEGDGMMDQEGFPPVSGDAGPEGESSGFPSGLGGFGGYGAN
jgi:hypothetical protein